MVTLRVDHFRAYLTTRKQNGESIKSVFGMVYQIFKHDLAIVVAAMIATLCLSMRLIGILTRFRFRLFGFSDFRLMKNNIENKS